MQFFYANLYSERLSGASVPTTEQTSPSVGTVDTHDDARLADVALVGSH